MKITHPSKLGFGLVAFAAIAGALAQAQAPQHQDHKPGAATPQHGGMMMPMDMGKHMAGMNAANAKLNALTIKMNAVRGAAKTDATAAVVTELVSQKKQMQDMCMMMMSHMGGTGHDGAAAPQHGGMTMPMDMGKHMAAMKAADAKLNSLTVKMNAARGSAKVDATAAVVTELVSQQKQMRAMCMGMMSHMGAGGKAPTPADHSKHTGG
jgi:hypothetical protein